jgi:hypothetical protein
MNRTTMRIAIAGCALVATTACLAPPVESPDTRVTQQTAVNVDQSTQREVDLLFMIDDSSSMLAMQTELKAKIDQLLAVFDQLARPTDGKDAKFVDLHIGVVTSDFGAGTGDHPTAAQPTGCGGCGPSGSGPGGPGTGGHLIALGKEHDPGCAAPVGVPFIKFDFDPKNASANNLPTGQDLKTTFRCMASVGAGGCGFEHQLESVYAALHNNVDNAGFLRDDAVLAVVLVTNEDDGSAPPDSSFYDLCDASAGPHNTFRQTMYGVECGDPPAQVAAMSSLGRPLTCQPLPNANPSTSAREYDVSRYVNYFTATKQAGGVKDHPQEDVILFALDAPTTPFTIANAIANGDGTQSDCDPATNSQCGVVLKHSCVNQAQPGFFGDPPVRIHAVVDAVAQAGHAAEAPICGDDLTQPPDYTKALQTIGQLITTRPPDGCVDGLFADVDNPDCVVEDLPPGGKPVEIERCDKLPANTFPCWHLKPSTDCKNSPQHVGVTIERNGVQPAQGTRANVYCETLAATVKQ